ncbi:MAG TPA: FHA domain-containing protein [Candidatus Anammoximicrobium sp.]|nr:FHA domain-containing protein [Candidatus Anammoximicrobium sp.]
MSLARLTYYFAVICGWAGFVGWLIAEPIYRFFQMPAATEPALATGSAGASRGDASILAGSLVVMVVAAIVGGAIGAGLSAVSGMANANWKQRVMRCAIGLVGGAVGGGLGGLGGNLLYVAIDSLTSSALLAELGRALGFAFLGVCVGVADGLFERSARKTRNGAIGGAIGGIIGGVTLSYLSAQMGSEMSGRATAFVVLGICIGLFIGLVQVVLREAWLTVEDGYGVRRQLILTRQVTVLGRGDHVALPFLGSTNAELELEHLRIVRQADGSYVLEDNQSKLGVSVRSVGAQYERVSKSRPLRNDDLLMFGGNRVRFNDRKHRAAPEAGHAQAGPSLGRQPPPTPSPPPPPKPKHAAPAPATAPSTTSAGPAPDPKPPAPTPSHRASPPPPPPKRRPD